MPKPNKLVLAAEKGDNALVTQFLYDRDEVYGIDSPDYKGATALHMAAYSNMRATVELLLDWGADRNSRDNDGNTPLHYACFGHCGLSLIQLLESNGASWMDKNCDGQRPSLATHAGFIN